jgi:hypothetical protein
VEEGGGREEGGRRREEGGRWREEGGGRKEEGGGRTEDGGQRTEGGGRRIEDGERRTEDGGRKTEGGQRREGTYRQIPIPRDRHVLWPIRGPRNHVLGKMGKGRNGVRSILKIGLKFQIIFPDFLDLISEHQNGTELPKNLRG